MCYGNTIHQCEGHRADHYSDLCGCYGRGDIGPCIWSKEEKIAWLEEYLDNLLGEVKFIKAYVTALKGLEGGLLEEGKRCGGLFLLENKKEGIQDENPNMADV